MKHNLSEPSDFESSGTESDDQYSEVESLANTIDRELETSIFHNRGEREYLSEGDVDRLITYESVRKELKTCCSGTFCETDTFLIDFIMSRSKKVFALTCLVLEGPKIYEAMKTFKDKSFDNNSLPIELSNNEAKTSSTGKPQRSRFVKSHPKAFKKREIWNAARLSEFEKRQWEFLAPVFDEAEFIRDLDERLILPLKQISNEAKEGTFGDIYQVEINPKHLDKSLLERNDGKTNIAVKEIKTSHFIPDDAATAFNIEAKALSKCRHVNHPNMLPCLAAFKMGPTYYFLLPWANGGNLRDFWKDKPNPELSSNFVLDILNQLHGLAEALEKLHGYVGKSNSFPQDAADDTLYRGSGGIRHGDLKPENILMFKRSGQSDIGTLKIADMGLAKHHEVNTRLRNNMTTTKYGTRRYEPPEVGAPRLPSPATSRLYDTWSMGCIILEFVVWLMYGQQGLDEFNDSVREGIKHDSEPPYYKVTSGTGPEKVAIVHPEVIRCMNDLSRALQTLGRQTALGDLLAVVKDMLLIVQLPSRNDETQERPEQSTGPTIIHPSPSSTEEVNTKCRVTAKVLRESLAEILGRAGNDSSYLFTGTRPQSRKASVATLSIEGTGGLHPNMAHELARRPKPSDALTQMRGNPVSDY
ncbi:hypothetical protein ACHAPJ_008749 [Fusarium lateritium]